MLYDNAQLAKAYVDAFTITKNERYREVAEDIFAWVLREMTDKEGGFYSALDADSEGEEGKFYLWSSKEVVEILGEKEGEVFCRVYGFEKEGNYFEEANRHRPGTNIAYFKNPLEEAAKQEKIAVAVLKKQLQKNRDKLRKVRDKRVWPHLDDKILASWNGLMIESFAYGGAQLKEPRYTQAAEKAANFILKKMRKGDRLLRTYRTGSAKLNAYLDDYAFLALGLLELYASTKKQALAQGSANFIGNITKAFP